MREIKFRAWDCEEMYYGVYPTDAHDKVYDPEPGIWRKVEAVMQYTGLKDKHGKEIYEGDIVRYEMPGPPPEDLMIEYIEPIIFSVASFDVEGAPLYVVNEVCEVIGNIHQQPELLNQ